MFKILFGVAVGTVFGRPILSFADKALGGISYQIADKTLGAVADAATRIATSIENRYLDGKGNTR